MISPFRVLFTAAVAAASFAALVTGSLGCASLAVATAPSKPVIVDDSPAAKSAEEAFWSTLHAGRYDDIGPVLEQLEAAYLAHPNDPRTTAHIAFLHIWRLSERLRNPEQHATVTDDLALARRYFQEAVALSPDDSRFRGFLAAAMLGEGKIHADEKLTRRGFFAMGDAVDAWPEFNLFTRGYVMSQLPVDDAKYQNALDDQWRTLDICAEAHIDRHDPDFSPFMAKDTKTGWKRACWNSWIAPHNLEGFFLNMGDMLVKDGDTTTAKKIYAQAKLSTDYASWPYRDVLERRIAEADQNVAPFRNPPKGDGEHTLMVASRFSCTGCHQQ